MNDNYKLTDEQISLIRHEKFRQAHGSLANTLTFARSIEAAAQAPLLARIAEQAMQLLSAQAQAQENHERAELLEAALKACKDRPSDPEHVWKTCRDAMKGQP